ncbi:RNA polymerase sigma-70 factor [Tamlana sp. 2201CG12-4]|uniref:RNA polymerase sigma factor n=1 Tax=Tamlana sp. 2201CG12-4 TaxID=3112582 RepID=UPI002DBF7E8F|nr:RNA polymerase sigma-70 factor [Tamlana sp. 2201CG12-4]MEC3905813.1 RNA polymerase sigma-70 factor [Tamlana sp. 2201CG12-4]
MNFSKNSLLALQLKNGNEKAYDFLMTTYYKRLCSYAYTLTTDHAITEDIVQNVFVEIWVTRKNINPKYSIKNYLFKAVYNEFIDQFRKNKPVVYLEKKYLETLDLVIEKDQKDLNEMMKLVDKEINNLPPKCKRIFLLNKKEGLTHIEISEYLSVSIKTVEGHITRAFKILSTKLDSKYEAILFLLFNFKQNT